VGYLVITHHHGLLPFANRLKAQGHDVDTVVWRQRFEKAWDGKISPTIRRSKGEVHEETLDVCREQVSNGDSILLTDVFGLEGFVGNCFPRLAPDVEPTSAIRLGGWFNGENATGLHLLIYDQGAWPGGMGLNVPGGLTMVIPDDLSEVDLGPVEEILKGQNFQGLFNLGIEQDMSTAEVKFQGLDAGWPFLHSHAFVSELENFHQILAEGEVPIYTPGVKFVTVVPVTIPPWPIAGKAESLPIQGLTRQDTANYFWHDVVVDTKTATLQSAGLDGLLGVARGAGYSHDLARAIALGRAGRLQVPEKQFRPDAGATVGPVIALLEQRYGLRI
jgi:hypothetical protein